MFILLFGPQVNQQHQPQVCFYSPFLKLYQRLFRYILIWPPPPTSQHPTARLEPPVVYFFPQTLLMIISDRLQISTTTYDGIKSIVWATGCILFVHLFFCKLTSFIFVLKDLYRAGREKTTSISVMVTTLEGQKKRAIRSINILHIRLWAGPSREWRLWLWLRFERAKAASGAFRPSWAVHRPISIPSNITEQCAGNTSLYFYFWCGQLSRCSGFELQLINNLFPAHKQPLGLWCITSLRKSVILQTVSPEIGISWSYCIQLTNSQQ